jgi:hypothetical protein
MLDKKELTQSRETPLSMFLTPYEALAAAGLAGA